MLSVLNKVTEILPDLTDYIIYAAIAIVTLTGFFKCLCPLWRTTHALKHAIHELREDAGNTGKPVWQEAGFVGRRLKGVWLRFLQNAEQLDRRGLPTNVEDYINDDTVTHGPGNATLAELIPNLLTSLGILGTFLGLSMGLSSLNISDGEALITQGIPNLLSGMKFAFGTSVAGISCSLVFNMINRISQGSSYHTIDEFVSTFTQLAMSRPLDNDVQLICQNQDRNHMLSEVNGTLVDRLAENVGAAVSTALNPVADSMDRFLLGTTRQQIDGVNHIVDNFVKEMNSSLNGQFLQLAQVISSINQNQLTMADQLEGSLRSVDGIVSNAESLQGLIDNILSHFNSYVSEIQTHRHRDEHFETNSAALLDQMHRISMEQAGSMTMIRQYQEDLTRSLNYFRDKNAESIQAMRQTSETQGKNLDAVSQVINKAGQDFSQGCEKFTEDTCNFFNTSLVGFSNVMKEMTEEISRKIDRIGTSDNNASIVSSLSEIQRMLAGMEKEMKTVAGGLTHHAKED